MTLEIYKELLRKLADNLEIRFLCPVYLVGSFNKKFQEALDIDIVIVMTEERMKRMFGDTSFNAKRFRFIRKQKLYFEKTIHGFDIDFKVQSESEFKNHSGPQEHLGKYVWSPE